MRDRLGVEPAPEQIAAELGLTARQLQAMMKATKATAGKQNRTDEAEFTDSYPDVHALPPDHRMTSKEDRTSTIGMLDGLEDRAETVLRLRFGLDGQPPATVQVVGDRLGLGHTRERVRPIERDSLSLPRERLVA